MKLLFAALFVLVGLFAIAAGLDSLGALEGGGPKVGLLMTVAVGIVLALAWVLFQEKDPELRPEDELPAIREALERTGRLEPDRKLDFRFEFVSTPGDLLNVERVLRGERMGLRGWVRGLLILLGVLFLAAFAWVTFLEHKQEKLGNAALIWRLWGSALLWYLVFQPLRVRRALRRASRDEQKISLTFTPRAIECELEDVGILRYSWRELVRVLTAKDGLLLEFRHALHWLPRRVFVHRGERKRLEACITARLAQEQVRIAAARAHPIVSEPESYAVTAVELHSREQSPGDSLDLTLRRGEIERRLRFLGVHVVQLDDIALEEAGTGVRIGSAPHSELDGFALIVVDAGEGDLLELWAEGVLDLDAPGRSQAAKFAPTAV